MGSELSSLSVAVIIPSFNESETIFTLVKALFSFSFIKQVVVVDDSPNEETINQLKSVKNDSRLTILHRNKKAGRGSAVIDGIKCALLDSSINYILEMDADFSHQPHEIPALIKKIHESKAGLVVASRYLPQSKISNWPLKRKIFSRCANKFAKALLKIPVSDYTNGFRVYSYSAATLLVDPPLLGTGFIALSDVLVRIYYHGLLIAEIPTVFNNRVRGESALNFKEITNAFLGIIKIYQFANKLKAQGKQPYRRTQI